MLVKKGNQLEIGDDWTTDMRKSDIMNKSEPMRRSLNAQTLGAMAPCRVYAGTGDIRVAVFSMQSPAHIAQAVEHFLGKEEVTGSIPVMGSTPLQSGTINSNHITH